MFLYAFICFYTLLHALIGRTVRRTTRSEADSLSNWLLPAEAGKNIMDNHVMNGTILYLANRWMDFKMLSTPNRFLDLIRAILLPFY